MKVFSTTNACDASPIGTRGTDIDKPGIYKRANSGAAYKNDRLLVLGAMDKFYFAPGSGLLELQTASACLKEHWVPVKEKITITFDTTEEQSQ